MIEAKVVHIAAAAPRPAVNKPTRDLNAVFDFSSVDFELQLMKSPSAFPNFSKTNMLATVVVNIMTGPLISAGAPICLMNVWAETIGLSLGAQLTTKF